MTLHHQDRALPPLPTISPLGISTQDEPHLSAIAQRFSALAHLRPRATSALALLLGAKRTGGNAAIVETSEPVSCCHPSPRGKGNNTITDIQ